MTIRVIILFFLSVSTSVAQIPLPEHPRPDFERKHWVNLNGYWDFEYDSLDQGVDNGWLSGNQSFSHKILVPFPWGSEFSETENLADIAWYKRQIKVDNSWKGKRIFVVIGAADWQTDIWIDGHHLGRHRGDMCPFLLNLLIM